MNDTEYIRRLIIEVCHNYKYNWPNDEWIDITDDVILNIYIDMDGNRRATAFKRDDINLEF